MSQVPQNLHFPPVSAEIPKGNVARYATAHKNLQNTLEDSRWNRELSGADSEQSSDDEDSYLADYEPSSDDDRNDEIVVPNPGVWGLGFETVLRFLQEKNWRQHAIDRLKYRKQLEQAYTTLLVSWALTWYQPQLILMPCRKCTRKMPWHFLHCRPALGPRQNKRTFISLIQI